MKFYKITLVFLLTLVLFSCNDKPELVLNSNPLISIFPNPVTRNAIIGVFAQNNESFTIKVFDTKGKLMTEESSTGRNIFQLSLTDKPKGNYQVVLIISQKIIHKKFVKI